jgi:1-acyl-sn-glycerol-3-phosphate acyltransferase
MNAGGFGTLAAALARREGHVIQSLAQFFRKLWRLSLFLTAAVRGLWLHRKLPRNATRLQCAEWLHQACPGGLRALQVHVEVEGRQPTSGLIVSNHVSYLDILAYSTALPCVFVSKAEVEEWPIFGRYARWSGSVFVRRHDRGDAARANVSVDETLKDGVPVILFPEGTTTDGQRVLRFHSTMLQPAVDTAAPITPCAIRYELEDGDAGREACWWGDMKLLPHVWNLLGKKSVRARIVFGEPITATGDRKQLSAVLHEEVLKLHEKLRLRPDLGPTNMELGRAVDAIGSIHPGQHSS